MRQIIPLVCVALLGLSGCGGDVSRTFGFSRDTPDEFTVTTRAPLSMPPSYMLAAPQPGATRPQDAALRSGVSTLVPQAALTAGGAAPSAGQQALLAAAGPPAPANIRSAVNSIAAAENPEPGLTDKLMFWRLPREPGTTVDPNAEAQRLRENAALGQSNQAGETVIIQPKRRTIFGF